jgi:DNA-binding GntR family transcriptional regulator
MYIGRQNCQQFFGSNLRATHISMAIKTIICDEIRKAILLGEAMPGEHLKEICLTDQFKCSRGPVREALIQLEKEGFIALVPHQGALVTKISAKDVEDFYALLGLLEGKAVEWATPLVTPNELDQLSEINKSIGRIRREDKRCVEEWIPLNASFHRFFRERCGNEKMNWITEEVRKRITRYRYTSLMVTTFNDYVRDHEIIIEAVRRGNVSQAKEAMERHISRAKNTLMEFLSRLPNF